ncbi:efflux RND transporter periplasmic adaptor subunit [Thalassomonas sp. M1454]|uniref:efflux RND transporter periplasmic adaptor subunit n=1 Tax=Thalassomonas sp. M1454 TaxID=2594477 RepID=UPI0011814C03|nr:efflux RND transporter periplasmic adaptor subunit [Thalassomonas sp. M1454]TRX55663.1 efflux RND transporter periplasmic adaptor subunit [Thalassomonas sp. M1454]
MNFMKDYKLVFLFFTSFLLLACEKPQQVKPDIEVLVNQVKAYPYKSNSNYVGRLNAASDVKIQARVKAKITEINFSDGTDVEEGDILFKLNDSELQAQLKQAKAEVSRANSALKAARKNYQRGKELEPDGYISSSEIDNLEAKFDEAKSSYESAQAKLETAEVNLAYTHITAPLSGKIDRSNFSVGDLVSPESGALTTIVAVDVMEVPFQISENTYWKIVRRAQNETDAEKLKNMKPIVKISLNNEEVYPYEGVITFVSNRVDAETGSMEIRATIPNPDSSLRPGQYVKVILESPIENQILMIEQGAVQSDQQGDFVMLVSADNTVNRQNVTLGKRVGTLVIVDKGLKGGETLVVQGVQRIRPGQTVKTKAMPTADAQQ